MSQQTSTGNSFFDFGYNRPIILRIQPIIPKQSLRYQDYSEIWLPLFILLFAFYSESMWAIYRSSCMKSVQIQAFNNSPNSIVPSPAVTRVASMVHFYWTLGSSGTDAAVCTHVITKSGAAPRDKGAQYMLNL